MKNIFQIGCVALSLAAVSSCTKKLDKEPIAIQSDASFYNTNDDMIRAVNAAYDPLGWESAQNTNVVFFNFFFGDIASDDANLGGDGKEPRVYPYSNFSSSVLNTSDNGLLNLWRKYYVGIYRTNVVITKAPLSKASDPLKNRVIGEAKFLRAYYYFKLIQMFGDVPLVTTLLTADEYIKPRSQKLDVYAQIETDLKDAAGLLPEKGALENGRATKGSAKSLLARVYLFQSKWSDLLPVAEEVINSKVYDLEKDYFTVHSLETENGVESIFEIQANSTVSGDERQNEGTFMNKFMGPRGQFDGNFGLNAPSEELYAEFVQDSIFWGASKMDPRKKATMIMEGDTVGGVRLTVYGAGNVLLSPGVRFYNRKYAVNVKFPSQTNGPSNQRVIRFADVLLMAAEAAFNLGKEDVAIKYIDSVRARVKMPKLSSKAGTFTGSALKTAIWKERRLELAMEGLRFFDVVRQGRAASLIKATKEGAAFKEGRNEVWPIPQSEIDLSGGIISQNPGY